MLPQENSILKNLFEGFTIHHTQKGNKFACWYSAWQTWVRNEIKFNPIVIKRKEQTVEDLLR